MEIVRNMIDVILLERKFSKAAISRVDNLDLGR
jgi:hypothetical protein